MAVAKQLEECSEIVVFLRKRGQEMGPDSKIRR